MKKLLILFLILFPVLTQGQNVINLDKSAIGEIVTILDSVQNWIWVSKDNETGTENGTMLFPYNTIAEGLAVASPGTMVIVVTPIDASAYEITDELVIPNNNVVLTGQGVATVIDGDGLSTNEHAISITGKTGCAILNLSIQTEDGGDKTSHCIMLNDGADGTIIKNVTIIDSDSDGIHIEVTNSSGGTVKDCNILDVDDNGIYVNMDAANTMEGLEIINNSIASAGSDGIETTVTGAGCNYAQINGNTIWSSGAMGMNLKELNYSDVNENIIEGSGTQGVQIGTSSTYNTISGNDVSGSGHAGRIRRPSAAR